MKKFLVIILSVFLLLPGTSVFANGMGSGTQAYVYFMVKDGGNIQFVNKYVGVTDSNVVFKVPAGATNLEATTGCAIKDGTFVSNATGADSKIEFHYTMNLSGGNFEYSTPVPDTTVTFLVPKGEVTSTEVKVEGDTSMSGDFNGDGIPDYYFETTLKDANKPVKFTYDTTVKNTAASTPQNNGQTGNTQKQNQSGNTQKDTTVKPAENDNTTLFIILGTFGAIVVVGVGLYLYFRSQNTNHKDSKSSNDKNEDEFVKLAKKRKDILSKISELQANLESGLITEEEHLENEKVLRNQLTKVTVKIKEFTE